MFKQIALASVVALATMSPANAEWTLDTRENKVFATADSYAGFFNLSFVCEPQKPIMVSFMVVDPKMTIADSNKTVQYINNNGDVINFDMDGVRNGIAYYTSDQSVVIRFSESIVGVEDDMMGVKWGGFVDIINMEGYVPTIMKFLALCNSEGV